MRDAYNRAPDPATWKATVLEGTVTVEAELKANLAVLDAIDKGLVVARELTGCGNAVLYAPLPGPASYQGAAEIFADDQLYIDTSKPTCEVYLSLEIEKASNATFPHRECGGRTPSHDAIDTTYSVLAGGTDALDPATLNGQISDGAAAHHDVQDTFPFLGAPH
jgi:hypothetical protein